MLHDKQFSNQTSGLQVGTPFHSGNFQIIIISKNICVTPYFAFCVTILLFTTCCMSDIYLIINIAHTTCCTLFNFNLVHFTSSEKDLPKKYLS